MVEKYLWLDKTTLVATYDKDDNLIQRFEYADGNTPISFVQSNQTYYIVTDHLGTPRAITDNNGTIVKRITYDSFGNVISDSNPSISIPFGFAGGLQDNDTKLVRFGFRNYDPETGRWTARDPIGFLGGDTNLYGYVASDPVNFIDSTGLYGYRFPSDYFSKRTPIQEISAGHTVQGNLIAGAGGMVGVNTQAFSESGNINAYSIIGKGVGKDVGVSYEGNIAIYTRPDGLGEKNWAGLFKTPNFGFTIFSFSYFYGSGWHGIGFGLQDLGTIDASFTEETYTPLFCE